MKLKINVKNITSCEKRLTIDVPQETVAEEFATFYQAVGKRAKIPGFRPGHAPKNVVALHYRDTARNEVLRELLTRTISEAVTQESLPVIGYPRVEKVEFDESKLKFDAHVEIKPKVKIDKYTNLSVTVKMHCLEVHVQQFLDMKGDGEKGLGYWSEQSYEAVHHHFKTEESRTRLQPGHDNYEENLLATVLRFNGKNI